MTQINGNPALPTMPSSSGAPPTLPSIGHASEPTGSRPAKHRRMLLVALILFIVMMCLLIWFSLRAHQEQEFISACPHRCRVLSARQSWEELAAVSSRWTRLEPAKADPWLFRAEAAEGLKDWSKVVEYLDRVPRSDDRILPALVRKAAAEFEQLNRPRDGVKTCDEVLQMDPRVLIAHKQTIFFFAMTLQRQEMVRRIRRAIEVQRESPESYVYLVSASWLYSGSLYRHNTRWLESDPDSELFQVARALQVYTSNAKTDLEHAAEFEHIPAAEQLLEQYPRNLELIAYFLNRGITDGDLPRVEALLTALPDETADARCWRARAWCQDSRGDLEGAEKSLRRAFALDPYWWQLHFQLHDLLRRLGKQEESARFLEIYKISKEMSTTIMTMNQSLDSLDEQKFCTSLLKLSELVNDEPIVSALRKRLSPP